MGLELRIRNGDRQPGGLFSLDLKSNITTQQYSITLVTFLPVICRRIFEIDWCAVIEERLWSTGWPRGLHTSLMLSHKPKPGTKFYQHAIDTLKINLKNKTNMIKVHSHHQEKHRNATFLRKIHSM